jgi:hypothetical protein
MSPARHSGSRVAVSSCGGPARGCHLPNSPTHSWPGAQSAVELDINPEWVAGYLSLHGSRRAVPVPLIPEQPGIPGKLLGPDSRDFFSVLAG